MMLVLELELCLRVLGDYVMTNVKAPGWGWSVASVDLGLELRYYAFMSQMQRKSEP